MSGPVGRERLSYADLAADLVHAEQEGRETFAHETVADLTLETTRARGR